MGGDQIVLGYPWFMASNLRPNWKEGTLAATVMVHTSGAAQKLGSPVSLVTGMRKVEVRNCPFLKKGKSLYVCLTQLNISTELAIQAIDKIVKTWDEIVFKAYHRFAKVFSEEAT